MLQLSDFVRYAEFFVGNLECVTCSTVSFPAPPLPCGTSSSPVFDLYVMLIVR